VTDSMNPLLFECPRASKRLGVHIARSQGISCWLSKESDPKNA
jgi:hypothetical protein